MYSGTSLCWNFGILSFKQDYSTQHSLVGYHNNCFQLPQHSTWGQLATFSFFYPSVPVMNWQMVCVYTENWNIFILIRIFYLLLYLWKAQKTSRRCLEKWFSGDSIHCHAPRTQHAQKRFESRLVWKFLKRLVVHQLSLAIVVEQKVVSLCYNYLIQKNGWEYHVALLNLKNWILYDFTLRSVVTEGWRKLDYSIWQCVQS